MQRRWQLLRFFLRQDIAQRYAGHVSGAAWVVLAPLLQLALFALVFGHIFKARVPGLDGGGYIAFLALGMWPWFAFAEGVTRAAGAITENAGLLDKVAMPPDVLIVARATTPFLLHGAGFALVLGVLLASGIELHWELSAVALLAWIPLYLLALGLGLLVAVLQVFVRDLIQLLGYLLAALMFLSPILYTREMVPAAMKVWLHLNPISALIEAIRDSLLFGRWDGAALSGACVVVLLGSGLCFAFYRRIRPHLHDFL